jgi:hypothetical protein
MAMARNKTVKVCLTQCGTEGLLISVCLGQIVRGRTLDYAFVTMTGLGCGDRLVRNE